MKTTIDLPEDLLRRAKTEAALRGRKLCELVAEGLQLRLEMKEEARPAAGTPEPLLRSLDDLPLIKGRPGAPKLNVTPQRVHELEMEAELERHEASLR
ncbi:MAG: DUF2191 domain-containing protein [Pseudomonadota bacterium]|nr:DUF2191 domain-containing protein [Pseudomonadota bacterium]